MISYDAFSLFTSIPLKETIDIAINLMFDKYPDLKISRQDRKKSFEFATSATYIFFLIAVIMIKLMELRWIFFTTCLSSLFMYFHEKKWLDQFQFCDVLLYRRYVDDIICSFNSKQDANDFLKFINTQHPNIKFTFEKQKDDKLAFLYILISKTDQNFCTSVYSKMTSIGFLLISLVLPLTFIKLD